MPISKIARKKVRWHAEVTCDCQGCEPCQQVAQVASTCVIYRVCFRSPSPAYMSREYKLLNNQKHENIGICVCSTLIYIYAPQLHHCRFLLVPACQACGCIDPAEVRTVICWWQLTHREVESAITSYRYVPAVLELHAS